MTDERRMRVVVSGLAFALTASAAYVAQRLLDYARGDLADPTNVLGEAHTAFYWRCAAAAWWGGLGAVVAWVLAGRARHLYVGAWRLALAAVPLAVAYVLLAWVFP